MSDRIFGIDIGTSNIKVFQKGKGIVINQKNIIAIQGKKEIIAFGDEAYDMFEKAPSSIEVSFPMTHGVIAYFSKMQTLLHMFLTQKEMKRNQVGKKEYYVAVPADITDVEKRAFLDLIEGANIKAKKIHVVEKPIVDALGSGLNVLEAQGIMMVNIGGDSTEISIISLGGIVLSKLLQIGGNQFDESICLYVKKKYNLIIGRKTAEELKIKLASGVPTENRTIPVMGRDLISGLPLEVNIDSDTVYEAIREYLNNIVDAVKMILERTPPELSSDIYQNGIYFTGASSKIADLPALIARETELKINIVDEPENSVIRGLGQIIEDPDYRILAAPMKQPKYN